MSDSSNLMALIIRLYPTIILPLSSNIGE